MEQMEIYNGYVEQEDSYYKKLETLEQCQINFQRLIPT